MTGLGRLWAADDTADRELASDGYSRYGAYLAQRFEAARRDEDFYDGPSWVAWCWWVATSPVMSPGYVTVADRVGAIDLWRDPDSGAVAASVEVRAPLAVALPGWRTWEQDRTGRLSAPRTAGPVALPTVTLTAPLPEPASGWVAPPLELEPRQVVVAAKLAVAQTLVVLEATFAAQIERVGAGRAPCVPSPQYGGLGR